MKKVLLSMAIAAVLFSTSCKKDEAEVTIVGKWTLTEVGADANNNNKVDQGETGPVSAVGLSGFVDIRGNNTFTISATFMGQAETVTGTYVYSNNMLTTVAEGETDVATVNTLTSNKLILKNAAEGSAAATWEVYTK